MRQTNGRTFTIVELLSRLKILILSGSHGTEEGGSGQTDKDTKNVDGGYGFCKQDCELLGIKYGTQKRRLPLTNWNGVPDITKPAEKDENQKNLLQDMDIRVCNIAYYYDNSQKLVEDIQKEILCTLNFEYPYVFYFR